MQQMILSFEPTSEKRALAERRNLDRRTKILMVNKADLWVIFWFYQLQNYIGKTIIYVFLQIMIDFN